MNNFLKLSNEEQIKAIEYNRGPLLIIAGAGTGKTHTIVEKIKFLIKNNLAKPEEILALTFTEKAACEMEERVDRVIPYGYFQMWISTFHAFADQILKDEISHIGITLGFKLMTEPESVLFFKKNFFMFDLQYFSPLGNPHKFIEAILQHFSRLKDEDITPEEYLKWVNNLQPDKIAKIELQKNLELAEAYKKYQNIKVKEGYFDFSDLIFYLLKLFRQRPNILSKYQKKFKYILIDEFQDTNISQYNLIKLLFPHQNKPKLTVVGDDSQAIYKFRGASVSNIMSFLDDYPRTKRITLQKNYRSNQTILDAAHKLIKNNDPDTLEAKLGISKNLIAQKKDNLNSINFYLAETVEQEAEFVTNEIVKLNRQYKFSDFALLIRANNHSDAFIRAFSRKGIPYQFLGPGMLFKQPEIKDLIAYLTILCDPENSSALYRVLTMSIFSLDYKDISLLLSATKKTNQSLFQFMEIYLSFWCKEIFRPEFEIYKKYLPLIREETRIKFIKIYQMINKHLGMLRKDTAGQILYYFLEDTGYLSKIMTYKTEREEKITNNISKFFGRLKAFETNYEDASVFAVIDYINMSLELGESPIIDKIDMSEYDAVNILTVHAAKGLEFPVVFLVNLAKGRFPTINRRETLPIPDELIKELLPQGDYHIEEERRLFYVGITRAMNKVYLSSSKYYGEGKRERRISPFIIETLGEDYVKKTQLSQLEEKKQLSIFDYRKTDEPIIKKQFNLTNFSFSQLETYKTCPLRYKYTYILKIPTTPNSAASFGDTIHKTMQKFYQEFLTDKQIDKKRLLEIYKMNWAPIGYSSKNHETRVKQEGEKMLINFFEKFHSPDLRILSLEKLFKIKFSANIFITGKIDRVDKWKNNEIEIIDYKTGKQPKAGEIKKNLQLSIYAIATADKGIFNKNLEQINLTFYYLQDMEKVTLKKNKKEISEVKNTIVDIIEEIRGENFLPNIGLWCDFCPFRILCEAWQ